MSTVGLKLFMMLAARGAAGVVQRIEHQAHLGDVLRSQLDGAGWRPVNETPLPVVCFTHAALGSSLAGHEAVAQRLRREQIAWVSKVQLPDGVVALRASITNFNTTAADVEQLVDALDRAVHLAARSADGR